jgi:hypothetical protein
MGYKFFARADEIGRKFQSFVEDFAHLHEFYREAATHGEGVLISRD